MVKFFREPGHYWAYMRTIIIATFLFCSFGIFSQELTDGFLILGSGDTVRGRLEKKSYFTIKKVKLYRGNKPVTYPASALKAIHLDSVEYVKTGPKRFFKKEISGAVNLYSFKKKKFLGAYDNDINGGRLGPAIKFYCDDYPNLKDSMHGVNKNNIHAFIRRYDTWKLDHPLSRSYFEKNIHTKPFLNFKISFFLPGAGLEVSLGHLFSINSIFKTGFGYNESGLVLDPNVVSQFRYYHNINSRKARNIRTYKYSGNYLNLYHVISLKNEQSALGIGYGYQRLTSKHIYSNLGVGAGWAVTGTPGPSFLLDIDLGYNF